VAKKKGKGEKTSSTRGKKGPERLGWGKKGEKVWGKKTHPLRRGILGRALFVERVGQENADAT